MTMNLGYGLDAELSYRHERLRAEFRRSHAANQPRRWWQRRPVAAVATHPARIPVRALHGAVSASTVEVALVAVDPVAVRSRAAAADSTDVRHAA